jgi:hypothetical protein
MQKAMSVKAMIMQVWENCNSLNLWLGASLKSHGLTARLWLHKIAGQAKATKKPSSWLGLARPILAWPGPAHGLKPGQSQH